MADEQTQDTQTPDANSAAGDELATRVQVLEEQLAAAQDQSLRVAADLQNVRRRAEQDVEKAHKFALEKFAGDLLPIIDSLERGLELSNPDDEKHPPNARRHRADPENVPGHPEALSVGSDRSAGRRAVQC